MRVAAVVQARMGSSRLPGKVLRELAGLPVLGWVVRALHRSAQVDRIVIATTTKGPDDAIAAYAAGLGVACVRGAETDVLSRFCLAVDTFPADAVVRITSDCPLTDPRLVDQVVAAWRQEPSWDYVATTLVRSLPRGLDVELVTVRALRQLDATARGYHREHVTSQLYAEPLGRRLLGLTVSPPSSDLRVTLDTEEDWLVLQAVTAALGNDVVSWSDLVRYLRSHPEVAELNADVEQKPLEAG